MTNRFSLHQLTDHLALWWQERKTPLILSIMMAAQSCQSFLEEHEEVIKGIRIGLRIANDLDTFRRLRTALKEDNAKKAAWYAFLLGLAISSYLQALNDLLDNDNEDDDNHDHDPHNDTPPSGPGGGIPKEVIRHLMEGIRQDFPLEERARDAS